MNEVEIAKKYQEKLRSSRFGAITRARASSHKETCKRFLEFLESLGYIMPSRLEIKRLDKIKELKQAIEKYERGENEKML